MKKFIELLTKEKKVRINGKILTLTFFESYTVYVKIGATLFPYLLINLIKERYISSAKNDNYLNKVIS